MSLRLEQLHQIIEVEKQHSISKAAKILYMGQPALSNSINNLEKEIGVCIFERNASGVLPTPEGKEILQLAKQMIEYQQQILSYGSKNIEIRGHVSVHIAYAYSFLYSDILLRFKNKFPMAELDLQIKTSDEILTNIYNGTINIGIAFLFEEEKKYLTEHDLTAEEFGKHEMMIYVSQDSRFAGRDSVSIEELQQEQFVAYSSGFWAKAKRQIHSEPLIMNDREHLKRMISSGKAIAMLPESFSKDDIYCEQGLLKLIPIKGAENIGIGVNLLLYPQKRKLTLLEKGTIELLQQILKENILDKLKDNTLL